MRLLSYLAVVVLVVAMLLASLADGCGRGPTTSTTTAAAAPAEGAAGAEAAAEPLTTAAPRRRRDLQDALKNAKRAGGGFNAQSGAEMGVGTEESGGKAKAKMGFSVGGGAGGRT